MVHYFIIQVQVYSWNKLNLLQVVFFVRSSWNVVGCLLEVRSIWLDIRTIMLEQCWMFVGLVGNTS